MLSWLRIPAIHGRWLLIIRVTPMTWIQGDDKVVSSSFSQDCSRQAESGRISSRYRVEESRKGCVAPDNKREDHGMVRLQDPLVHTNERKSP